MHTGEKREGRKMEEKQVEYNEKRDYNKIIENFKEELPMKVTPDMTIGELLRLDENIVPILMRAGMHCIGCPPHRENHWQKQLWFTELTEIC